MSDKASPSSVEELNSFSRDVHGHRYVLPVALWILEHQMNLVSTRDAMVALGGRADRARALEALERLAKLGALIELPRDSQLNSPREFQRRADPYWDYVAAKLAELGFWNAARGEGPSVRQGPT